MRNTVEIMIPVGNESVREELIALLSDADFDAFEERENELLAFIKEEDFDISKLEQILASYKLAYTRSIIEDRNWNAYWESNFEPVIVDDFCAIRADFHKPLENVKYEIIITPKMSFGTGHHATTYMMIKEMSKLNFAGMQTADFGTGTGVLAILAEKLGSDFVWAIDNDDWSIENSRENIERNDCNKIFIEKADSFKAKQQFDIILANINKSVILQNVDGLLFGLTKGGKLLLSGLLKEDENDILSALEIKGCRHVSTQLRNNWICLLLQYNTNF